MVTGIGKKAHDSAGSVSIPSTTVEKQKSEVDEWKRQCPG